MRSSSLSVLLATEGTYPFYGGGVSTWCDRLTQGLPEIQFKLFSITTDPFAAVRYPLAQNVTEVTRASQWGLTQPAEYQPMPLATFVRHRWRTKTAVIERTFRPLFEQFLSLVFTPAANMEDLGEVLVSLHLYFRTHDYWVTMNSPAAWDVFHHAARATYEARPAGTERPSFGELKQAFRLLYHLLTVLHTRVPETAIAHSSAAAFCGIPCVLSKLLRGTPYLLTEHGIYLREQYLNLRAQIKPFFVRWFLYRLSGAVAALSYHFADQVSPVCAYNARWERQLGVPENRLKVIFNGVDPDKFHPSDPVPKSRPRVATVGLIYPLKGQCDLIRASAVVKRHVPDLEVQIFGAATDKTYFTLCKDLVREHDLGETVTFAGLTKEPWKVYSNADIVALPSISEGFPYVVVEAMLCGATVVASDVGGVREALGNTGVLTPSRNPEALAQAVTYLLTHDEARRRLGAKALVRARELFTERQFLKNYEEAYWDLWLGVRSRTLQITA